MAKLVACLVATAALWVRILTSLKNYKMATYVAKTLLPTKESCENKDDSTNSRTSQAYLGPHQGNAPDR